LIVSRFRNSSRLEASHLDEGFYDRFLSPLVPSKDRLAVLRWCGSAAACVRMFILVVVVHGVGDPEPGKTLSLLSRSIADQERPYVENPKTTWLFEKANETGQTSDIAEVKTFPVYQTNVRFKNKNTELCEAFWGDLSRAWFDEFANFARPGVGCDGFPWADDRGGLR